MNEDHPMGCTGEGGVIFAHPEIPPCCLGLIPIGRDEPEGTLGSSSTCVNPLKTAPGLGISVVLIGFILLFLSKRLIKNKRSKK